MLDVLFLRCFFYYLQFISAFVLFQWKATDEMHNLFTTSHHSQNPANAICAQQFLSSQNMGIHNLERWTSRTNWLIFNLKICDLSSCWVFFQRQVKSPISFFPSPFSLSNMFFLQILQFFTWLAQKTLKQSNACKQTKFLRCPFIQAWLLCWKNFNIKVFGLQSLIE